MRHPVAKVAFTILCCIVGFFALAQKKTYPQTLLWRITGNNLSQPSYLYGTMHITDKRVFYFGDSLYKCLEKAQGYAMEINPDSAVSALFQSILSPDTSGLLKDAVDAKEFAKIARRLENEFGVPADKITKKQAWLYSYKSGKEKRADDMDSPVDTYLYNIAKRQGKWVGGIEDVEDQLNLMEEFGSGFNLNEIVFKEQGKAALEKLTTIYADQDLQKINEFINASSAKYKDEMLDRRNIKMAYRMDSMAHVRSNFFAVGAAHLPGENGVIHLLEQKGYILEPIVSSKKIAPDQYTYKEVELPWQTIEDEEKTFTVEMPGKAFPMKMNDGQFTMHCYADLGTGLIYFVMSIRSPLRPGNADSLFAMMSRNLSNNGSAKKPVPIEFKGMRGYEVIANKTNSYFYRMRMFVQGELVYIIMTGSEKEALLKHKESDRFLGSLVMYAPPVTPVNANGEWTAFDLKERGMSVMFPGKPSRNKQIEKALSNDASARKWKFDCYTYSDVAKDAFYMLTIKETSPGYLLYNDSSVFVDTRDRAKNSFAKSIPLYKELTYQGYPALRMDAEYKQNNLFMQMLTVNKASRVYSLVVITEKGKEDTAAINRYLQSFQLYDTKLPGWSVRQSEDKKFSAWAPAPFQTIYYFSEEEGKEKDTTGSVTLSYDSLSSVCYQVLKRPIGRFYWTDSDSSFFADALRTYKKYDDSILMEKPVMNGAVKGMDYLIELPGSHNLKRVRLLPYGDTLYVAYAFSPRQQRYDTDKEKFFDSFRFTNDNIPVSYNINKTKQVLEALHSTDSATSREAWLAINDCPFSKKDLPLLNQALLENYDDAESWLYNNLVKAVTKLQDSSTVGFIAEQYSNMSGDKEKMKYKLLSVLAKIKTQYSYNTFRDLLQKQLPVSGDPDYINYSLTDSLALTASIIQSLLPLGKDTLFVRVLPYVINELADSSLLPTDILLPYKKDYYRFAAHELKEMKKSPDDYSTIDGQYLIKLLTRLNDAASNSLLQQFLQYKGIYVKEQAALGLIKNKQAVDPLQLEKIAADKSYRADFYAGLQDLKKENLFPLKYRTQRSLAESEMYGIATADDDTAAIVFIGERVATFKGKQQRFYLFKVTINPADEDAEPSLGIAGPYDMVKPKLMANGDASGFYWKETYDAKKINEQFKKYLEGLEEENEEE